MHLKLIFISCLFLTLTTLFFTLTSANYYKKVEPSRFIRIGPAKEPKHLKEMHIVPVSKNNLYNKAKADILKYKILIYQERDTVAEMLKMNPQPITRIDTVK